MHPKDATARGPPALVRAMTKPTTFAQANTTSIVITNFSASQPFTKALRDEAKARGVSISSLVREALQAYGIAVPH